MQFHTLQRKLARTEPFLLCVLREILWVLVEESQKLVANKQHIKSRPHLGNNITLFGNDFTRHAFLMNTSLLLIHQQVHLCTICQP